MVTLARHLTLQKFCNSALDHVLMYYNCISSAHLQLVMEGRILGPDPAVAQFVTQPTSTTQAVCLGLGLLI